MTLEKIFIKNVDNRNDSKMNHKTTKNIMKLYKLLAIVTYKARLVYFSESANFAASYLLQYRVWDTLMNTLYTF